MKQRDALESLKRQQAELEAERQKSRAAILDAKREANTIEAVAKETGQVAASIADASMAAIQDKNREIDQQEQRVRDLDSQLQADKKKTKDAKKTAEQLANRVRADENYMDRLAQTAREANARADQSQGLATHLAEKVREGKLHMDVKEHERQREVAQLQQEAQSSKVS